MSFLRVLNVTKRFSTSQGVKAAVQDVSLEAPQGTVLCLLGPNGSGKTTLLKTIATLLTPDEGRVFLDGTDAHKDLGAAKRLLGFASSEDHSFYGRLSVRLNLWFYAQLHNLPEDAWKRRLAEVGEQLDLLPFLDRPFRELSSGQKQRLLLARALLHDPPVLLLDEPHQNLDPLSSIRLRELMTQEWGKRRGKTILVSTHHLEDARKTSDRWVVLREGQVRFQGSVDAALREGGLSVDAFFQGLMGMPAAAAGA